MACVGVGNVGRSWAVVFARAGWEVALWDLAPEACARAAPLIRGACEDLRAAGLLDDVEATLARIRPAASLEAALEGAVHFQESAAEAVEVKRALFERLDALASPEAILASSTSAIPGSAFLEHLPGRARALVAHPVNPPHLIPLVEICAAPWTSAEAVGRTVATMRAVSQSPVVLKKEVPGFLLNRLQWALLAEALHLVGEGYCSTDDIDAVLKDGLALRWAFIGPFEVGHLNAAQGLKGYFEVLAEAFQRVQQSLKTDYVADPATIQRAHDALADRIPVHDIPERQAWRDRRLMALRRHLSAARETIGEPVPMRRNDPNG
jgi:3-hydroxyacyl-CoA dehydrogenase